MLNLVPEKNMLSSKEVIEFSSISRATLNNYIAQGLVERPIVRSGVSGERARRMGYFSADVLDRISQIQQLKNTGLSMQEIVEEITNDGETNQPALSHDNKLGFSVVDIGTRSDDAPYESAADFPFPTYWLNSNFELGWWNDEANNLLFEPLGGLGSEIENRSIFRSLLAGMQQQDSENWKEMLQAHTILMRLFLAGEDAGKLLPFPISLLLAEINTNSLDTIISQLDEHVVLCRRIEMPISHKPYDMYALLYEDSILVSLIPTDQKDYVRRYLKSAERRIPLLNDLLPRRLPCLTPLAVVVADLQSSVKISAALPPEEYFALINEIWTTMMPIFKQYHGRHDQYAGDGGLYYFFPQPTSNYLLNAIHCAHKIKLAMDKINRNWQRKKGWPHQLKLNIGLHSGREWFGSYHAAPTADFTVLGDTINYAARLSDYATEGSLWITKDMMSLLSSKEREQLRFGVGYPGENTTFVEGVYASIGDLIESSGQPMDKFSSIATLAVTEIEYVEF